MQCYKQFLLLLLISLKSSKKTLLSELMQGFCLGNMLPVKNLNLHFFLQNDSPSCHHIRSSFSRSGPFNTRSSVGCSETTPCRVGNEDQLCTEVQKIITKLLGIMKRQTILYTKIKVCGTFFRNDKCPNFLGTFHYYQVGKL